MPTVMFNRTNLVINQSEQINNLVMRRHKDMISDYQ